MGTVATPSRKADMEKWLKFSDADYEIDIKNIDSRTVAQNSALHLWCSQLAKVLNAHALYMTGVFGNEIEWTMDLVKTQIVKATIKKVFNINSTTKLMRKEIDTLIDYVTIAFAKKQIETPQFPSRELWEKEKGK